MNGEYEGGIPQEEFATEELLNQILDPESLTLPSVPEPSSYSPEDRIAALETELYNLQRTLNLTIAVQTRLIDHVNREIGVADETPLIERLRLTFKNAGFKF